MKSKFIEGHITKLESILDGVRDLITEQGETTPAAQEVINQALEALSGWYEMREMFE